MTENKKSYYAIIPANVRYNSTLPMGAKLLYGEITALCNERGYCWACNSYFADLYEVGSRTISGWVTALHRAKYVHIEIDNMDKTNTKRRISIPHEKNFATTTKNSSRGPRKNLRDGHEKNCAHSTTLNTTVNSTVNNTPCNPHRQNFEQFWKAYPRRKGKGAAQRAWDRIKPDGQLFSQILAAIEQQKQGEDWLKENGRFIPHPTTWLNQERWLDEMDANEGRSEWAKVLPPMKTDITPEILRMLSEPD